MLSPRQLRLLLETWQKNVLNRLWLSHGERSCCDWQLVVLSTGSSVGKPPSCFHTSGATMTSLVSIHRIFSVVLELQVKSKHLITCRWHINSWSFEAVLLLLLLFSFHFGRRAAFWRMLACFGGKGTLHQPWKGGTFVEQPVHFWSDIPKK